MGARDAERIRKFEETVKTGSDGVEGDGSDYWFQRLQLRKDLRTHPDKNRGTGAWAHLTAEQKRSIGGKSKTIK